MGFDPLQSSGDELLTPELQQSRVPPHYLCDNVWAKFQRKEVLKEHLTPMLKADEQQFAEITLFDGRSPILQP